MAGVRAFDRPLDILAAGLAGAALSGVPSTLHALATRRDVLAGGRAAGRMLLPRESRTGLLLAAAVPVHLGLSLGWAAVLAPLLPRGAEVPSGAAGALAIAALDLELIARRHFPPIRALPQLPQWADHLAFGVTVGAVLARRRRAAPVPTGWPARAADSAPGWPWRAPDL
jgi:hypothetical protein